MARHRSGPWTGGQSLAEFALILPVLALLMTGAIDLARVFYVNVTLANAARVTAEFALDDKGYLKYRNMTRNQFQALDYDGDGNSANNTDPCSNSDPPETCGRKRATLVARYLAVKEARLIGLPLADVAVNPDASFNSSLFTWTPNAKYAVAVRSTFRPFTPMISAFFGGIDPVMRHTVQLRHNCTTSSACSW